MTESYERREQHRNWSVIRGMKHTTGHITRTSRNASHDAAIGRRPKFAIAVRLALVGIVLAVFAGACTEAAAETPTLPAAAQLLTQRAPAQGCDEALAQGRLGPDVRSGLGLIAPDGETQAVTWPFGYSVVVVEGMLVLLDEAGRIVAREGELIQMGGGTGADGTFYACPGTIQHRAS